MAITEKVSAAILIPEKSISNQSISDADGDEITADKTHNPHRARCNFNLAIATTPPVAREEIVFVARKAGTIRTVAALLDNTGSSGVTIDFDLKKNGASILTAVINFTHADSDGQVKTGTLSSSTFVAGDRFSMVLSGTMGTAAAGPLMIVDFDEVGLP